MTELLEPPPRTEHGRGWAVVVMALLMGSWLLAHLGCHGDEDNELFAAATEVVGPH